MARLRIWLIGLVCMAGISWTQCARAQSPAPNAPPHASDDKAEKAKAASYVPLGEIPEKFREGVRVTIEKPTIFSQAPVERFACQPHVYYWLLDHPDRGVVAWRRLGASCVMIGERGPGRFGWIDEHGSDLQWETVFQSNDRHIWYAEGKVRPGPLLPLVPVKALVVLRYTEQPGPKGTTIMEHQADMFLYTDNLGAALAAKLFGAAAPKMAEQCVSQMQTFFAGMAWYIQRYPDRAPALLMESGPATFVPQ